MTAGLKSDKAQNERMFFRFAPESGHARLSLYRAAMTATLAPPIARAAQELVQRNFEAP